MSVKIALAGNPNCGKNQTLFNALTGSNQFVGNWPGVTVEKNEGKLERIIKMLLSWTFREFILCHIYIRGSSGKKLFDWRET